MQSIISRTEWSLYFIRLAENKNLTIGVLEAGPDLSNEEIIKSGGVLAAMPRSMAHS